MECHYFPTEPVQFVATALYDDCVSTGMSDIFLSVKGLLHAKKLQDEDRDFVIINGIVPISQSVFSIYYEGEKWNLDDTDELLKMIKNVEESNARE